MTTRKGPGFAPSDKCCSSSQLYTAAAAINCNPVEHLAAQEPKCFSKKSLESRSKHEW